MKKLLVLSILIFALIFSLASCSVTDLINGFIGDSFNEDADYAYTDFTSSQKSELIKILGDVIPFAPCDDYYVGKHTDEGEFENGIRYYTVGNTEDDFEDYLDLFGNYDSGDSYTQSDGTTWFVYTKGDILVHVAYYRYEGKDYIDVYAKLNLPTDDGNDDENDDNGNGGNDGGETLGYLYTDFTSSEKAMFNKFCGFVIPFIANDNYTVEEYTYNDEVGINFYTFGNTAADFASYKAKFSTYTYVETYQDEYGDDWFTYQKGDFYIDISYYDTLDYGYCVDVYVYTYSDDNGGSDEGGDSYLYTGFTSSEKAMFNEFCGFVIPFIANDNYTVEGYTFDDEVGINFYTFGNTAADFANYKAMFSIYTYIETYQDEYGDDWFTYQNGDFYIDISFYDTYDYGYCIDVYVYTYGNNDDNGGSDQGGNVGGNTEEYIPDDGDGVYEVDFRDAENVKNVSDQGYYLDGCPTVGSPAVLVIPVDFRDVTASSKGYNIDSIKNAFEKNGVCDYYSVYDYYYISSYGQLALDITVLDFWFRPQYSSTYYQNATMNYYGDDIAIGDQLIMDEALAYLSQIMDLSAFDSDGNDVIDAIIFINTLEIGDDDFHWAYRYWNVYTDDAGYYFEYDGVSANDYMWASYQFLFEAENGSFDNSNAMNTYTYIHEFGHILGADDYYDTAGVNDPMGGCDIMDAMSGDHNAFTKFNYGWLTTSRLVTTETSVTLTLEDFSKNGDTIIIANNWSERLGAYQEYYIIVYYRQTGLNGDGYGYFARDGIVVYHVNATLYSEESDGEIYYDIYNNNTDYSDDYGTKNNLIEFIVSVSDTYTYTVGDSLHSVKDDNGNILQYTFTVDDIEGDYATLTFTKR